MANVQFRKVVGSKELPTISGQYLGARVPGTQKYSNLLGVWHGLLSQTQVLKKTRKRIGIGGKFLCRGTMCDVLSLLLDC